VIIRLPAPKLPVKLEGDAAGVDLVRKALANAGPGNVPSLYVREAVKNENAEYRVLARDGLYLIALAEDDRALVEELANYNTESAGTVVARLEHIERWKTTLELANPSSDIGENEVQVELLTAGGEPFAEQATRLEYARKGEDWEQPSFKLRLRNKGTRTVHVGLLDLPETFGIYPLLAVPSQKLGPGEEVFANDGKPIPAAVPDHLWKRGMVEIKDALKVIVSTTAFDVRRLFQEDLPPPLSARELEQLKERNQMRGGEAPGGTLEQLLNRVQTRHAGTAAVQRVDDWRALHRQFTTVRPLGAAPLVPGKGVTLLGGVTVEPHRSLKVAEVRLDSASAALRGLAAAPPPPRLFYDDPAIVEPFELVITRSGSGPLNVLELHGVEGAEGVTTAEPLVVTVPRPLAAGERVLPVASDGEFHLPLGRAEADGERTRIILERLPRPEGEESARSLGGSLRIFFQKVVSRLFGASYPYPVLAVAEVDENFGVHYEADPARVRARVAKADRIALFIHGIIGDTKGMAASLKRAGVADRYDLVLAFDYDNLNDPISDTARGLKQRLEQAGLAAGHGKKLDLLAHSMGGLVSRWFIEREGGDRVVRRLVMLGTPNGGSPWPGVVDWATTALAVGLNALSKVVWPASVLAGLVQASGLIKVALRQMAPGSELLENLYASIDPKLPYTLIAGNTSQIPASPAARSRLKRLLARLWSNRTKYELADLFFSGADNDIAVSTESMRRLAEGRSPACEVREAACDHLTYFSSEAGLAALKTVLS
jgi:pimeloyl-ACP methyl ester carboxylesterase